MDTVVTDGVTVPQVTPPAPLHVKLNVLDAEPVLITVKGSLWPPAPAVRVGAVAPSGVTLTPVRSPKRNSARDTGSPSRDALS